MKWSEIFPKYPFRLGVRKGWKVKIGSRKIFVDLPYIFPLFLSDIAYRYRNSGITKGKFQEEKQQWLSQHKDLIYINGKPIADVRLTLSPFHKKQTLLCIIKWKTFFAYLDRVSFDISQQIRKNGEEGLATLYNYIYDNYHGLFYGKSLELQLYPRELEDFKRVVRRTGENDRIRNLLYQIKKIAYHLEKWYERNYKLVEKEPSIKLFTLHLELDVEGALRSLENENILSIYFYLRNILELLVKIFVYIKVAEELRREEVDRILGVLYFYDKRAPLLEEYLESRIKENTKQSKIKLRRKSIPSFNKDFRNKMLKILTQKVTEEDLFSKMISKSVPILGISRKVLEDFCRENGINLSFVEYWRACSYAIHQQTPLPFYSLLEVKGLRAFLETLLDDLVNMVSKLTGIPKKSMMKYKFAEKRILTNISLPKHKIFKETEKAIYNNKEKIKRKLMEISESSQLQKNTWFKPKTLVSLFELISGGTTKIKSGVFQPDDIDELAHFVHAIGFKVDVYQEINQTFEAFHLVLYSFLEKIIPQFKNLSEDERRGVTFYLLALYLPECLKV